MGNIADDGAAEILQKGNLKKGMAMTEEALSGVPLCHEDTEIRKDWSDEGVNVLPGDRPRKLLPDMDAIDEMVQKGTKVIEELQEILNGLRAQGGIEIIVEPQAPTEVHVPRVIVRVPLKREECVG